MKTETRTEGGVRTFPAVTICGLTPETVHGSNLAVANSAYKAAKIAVSPFIIPSKRSNY